MDKNTDKMFDSIAKHAGVKRYSREYNEIIWTMVFQMMGTNPEKAKELSKELTKTQH